MRQALSDLRVCEIGGGVAAGWCGKVFADLGADVVKVEPPGGDSLRADPGMFAHLNTNKRSSVVEVAPVAAPSLVALLDGVDLVIDTPGIRSLADWGLDTSDVLARTPTTTVLAITGFGATGPYADYAWSDLVAQAFSGALVGDATRTAQAADVGRRDRGRSHRGARCARRDPAGARDRRRRVPRLLSGRGVGVVADSPLAVPGLGVPRARRQRHPRSHGERHPPADRHLSLRRRIRRDDDDDPAARRDAHRAGERGAARRVRAT